MASSSTQPPSSSSTSGGQHDVFLSFYGQSIHKDFTDYLYAALKRKGILTFPRGKYCSEELLKAIQQSTYAVVVISRNYASSKRCLIELTEILECVRKTGLTILPVFYHVDPRDVRNQKGLFAEAFAKHKHDPKIDVEMRQSWTAALKQVGYICGWDLKERSESTVVEEIMAKIFSQLHSTPSRVYCSNIVGIDTSVKKIMHLLNIELNDVRFIGIWGVGGIGKTTLAEVIYHRVSDQFEACTFISSIRENSKKHGLVSLQNQLVSVIPNSKEMCIGHVVEGIHVLSTEMHDRKILIVLEYVDAERQLKALAGSCDWFGAGSKIIVTSRDNHLLKRHVNDLYKIEALNNDEALKLFSLSAFNKPHLHEDYVDFLDGFIKYAQGLPLALKVLGSSLSNKTTVAWKSVLDQLNANPKKETLDVLEIGFVGLENMQKKLFLDIACFFEGEVLDNVLMDTLKSFGYHSRLDIEVLIDKSFITRRFGKFEMHDLLQEMGKEIVQRESPMKPGQRSRLWQYEDVLHVLKNNTGTNVVEGIVLQLPLDKEKQLRIKGFKKMKNLRILKLDGIIPVENLLDKLCAMIGHEHPLKFMPTKKLCLMKWDGYPFECLPTNFQANNLVELSIHGRNIKELWKGTKSFGSLKRLDLSRCWSLIKTPNFTEISNLEFLDLSESESLFQIHQSIGVLRKLKELHLRYCYSLISLPLDMTGLESLEVLTLSWCLELDYKFLEIVGMTSLQQLHLDYTYLKKFPPLSNFSGLFHLNLEGCSRLKDFPDLSGLNRLAVFNANDTAITKLPSSHLFPKNLEKIKVSGSIDLPAESGEFLWFNISPASYEDDDHISERISHGRKKIDCRRNFLEGFYIKKGGDILYFGLGAHQDQQWRFVKQHQVPVESPSGSTIQLLPW